MSTKENKQRRQEGQLQCGLTLCWAEGGGGGLNVGSSVKLSHGVVRLLGEGFLYWRACLRLPAIHPVHLSEHGVCAHKWLSACCCSRGRRQHRTLFSATMKGVFRIFSIFKDSMVCFSKPCIMSTTSTAMSHLKKYERKGFFAEPGRGIMVDTQGPQNDVRLTNSSLGTGGLKKTRGRGCQ